MGWLTSIAAFFSKILSDQTKEKIYQNKPLAGAIRSGLNAAVPTGKHKVEVSAGELAGFSLMVDMKTEKDYWLGTYEMDLQAALRELVQPGMVTYDVGANIGYFSLMLAKLSGETGQVHAFEPLPSNIERLLTNVSMNGYTERISIYPVAVTEFGTPIRFLVHTSEKMGKVAGTVGKEDNEAYQDSIEVASLSLDQFAYLQGNPLPQLVKMDIEGGEVKALPGMRRMLEEEHPILLLELHGLEACSTAWKLLQGIGYRLCWMKPGFPSVASLEELKTKAYVVAVFGES